MIPLRDDNPTSITPVLTVGLIAACVLAFFWQLSFGAQQERVVFALGVIPAVLFGHAQLPEGIDNVERAMGHLRFIVFYVVCGLAAAFAQALPDPQSTIPMIGASGAISGVLGAYLLLYPHARVLVAIPFGFYLHTMSLKAGWVLGFWFLMQLVSSVLAAGQQGGVAFGAHIGGFVAGLLLVPLFKRRGVPLFHPGRFG